MSGVQEIKKPGYETTLYQVFLDAAAEMPLEDRSSALKVERYIKAMKSKVFIRKLVGDAVFREEFKTIVAKKFGVRLH